MKEFKKKILIIGYGAVGKCALPVLLKHVDVPYKNITVIDFADKREEIRPWTRKGVKYFQEKITPVNVARTLSRHVGPGDLIMDVSWNIDCLEMLRWCHENKVLYVNTSMEEWDPYANIDKATPLQKSIYYRQMLLNEMVAPWNDSSTAIIDHGANPGLVSHFVKHGLIDIAEKSLKDKATSKRDIKTIERLLHEKRFNRLAMKLGVKVIHVSERDTQMSDKPKRVDEFVNTWSVEGLREEATSPVEMGWGTHEKELPPWTTIPDYGPKNQIFLSQMGMNTWARSWVPDQEIVGMIIRHPESFTITDHLSVWRSGKPVYRPTVHYVYMPCDETMASLHELRCRNYEIQPRTRILDDEIIGGEDMLGVLLMGHKYNSWWTGSVLSIGESRKLVPHQNATTTQVAIGVVSAVMWAIEHPNKGVVIPDDLPHDYILNIAKHYLGNFVSKQSDWTPFRNYQVFFHDNFDSYLDKKNMWCFRNFIFKH